MSVFEHATQKAELWINEMMSELGTDDPRLAYHALGASLQALRDRLRVDEAAQLAAQLPLVVRGLYYEGWRPAATPVRARRPDDFITMVDEKLTDGRDVAPERALTALFEVMRRHLSPGEIDSLVRVLPAEFAQISG
jgi:uncharacterized protein (DUF2267 family)